MIDETSVALAARARARAYLLALSCQQAAVDARARVATFLAR